VYTGLNPESDARPAMILVYTTRSGQCKANASLRSLLGARWHPVASARAPSATWA